MDPSTSAPDGTSDAFIRHVAHDLRASLNVVVSWAELVKAGHLGADDLPRAGDTIVRHARHLSQRLTAALDLWRLDSGLLPMSPRVCTAGAVVRAAAEEARPQCESRRVQCRVDSRDDGWIQVDATRLTQALTALLADAAANTPAGDSVEMTVEAEDTGLVVRIVGGGQPPAPDAFARNPAETPARGGARPFDFGLALAQALVALNGGVLEAEAVGADRTAFVVRLPIVPAPAS